MELYIHIPFCVRKCNYCDFLSFPGTEDAMAKYTDTLIKELDHAGRLFPNAFFDTVFIGGGTPSILPLSLSEKLLTKISECAPTPDEFTVECNPGTVTPELLKLYRELSVNRLSFGLQSADDKELKRLGRIHTFTNFLKSFEMARIAGFTNINIDLMSAIPGQDLKSWERTLTTVSALKPEHISAYSLIVEEGTPFAREAEAGTLDVTDEDTEREMYHVTAPILGAKRYGRYEISNYCLPGHECRHNLGYWTGAEYLGLGLGASSYVSGAAGSKRYKNTDSMEEYLKGSFEQCEVEQLSHDELMAEYIILHLRLIEGFSKAEFYDRFGVSFDSRYKGIVSKYIELGLMTDRDGFVALTESGLDVSNAIMAEFV